MIRLFSEVLGYLFSKGGRGIFSLDFRVYIVDASLLLLLEAWVTREVRAKMKTVSTRRVCRSSGNSICRPVGEVDFYAFGYRDNRLWSRTSGRRRMNPTVFFASSTARRGQEVRRRRGNS